MPTVREESEDRLSSSGAAESRRGDGPALAAGGIPGCFGGAGGGRCGAGSHPLPCPLGPEQTQT